MLEDHVEQSIQRMHDLLAEAQNPADFIDALEDHGPQPAGSARSLSLLHMEMILFVARAEKRRPELAKRLRAAGKLVTDIVETTSKTAARNLSPVWWAILLAMEDGFRLHRLIDPETTPADSFLRAISDLQRDRGCIRHENILSRRARLPLSFARDRPHLARRRLPDRDRRQDAHGDADRKGQRVTAREIVQQPVAHGPAAPPASAASMMVPKMLPYCLP